MEPKFQTSFIPRKTLSAAPGAPVRHSASLFMILAIILFVLSLGAAGLAFVGKDYLTSQQATDSQALAEAQEQFNTTLISTLSTTAQKIALAKELLANHVAADQIFGIVSQLTVSNVQWKSFQFSVPSASAGQGGSDLATVSMQGVADSFYTVAYQSDVFGQSSQFGTDKAIKDPVLSNLAVDPTTGKVSFSFTASVDPSELSYDSSVSPQASAATGTPAQ
jgi:hypothetical protein